MEAASAVIEIRRLARVII
jgi:hypothetical protein